VSVVSELDRAYYDRHYLVPNAFEVRPRFRALMGALVRRAASPEGTWILVAASRGQVNTGQWREQPKHEGSTASEPACARAPRPAEPAQVWWPPENGRFQGLRDMGRQAIVDPGASGALAERARAGSHSSLRAP
jgi:hypothetical protein